MRRLNIYSEATNFFCSRWFPTMFSMHSPNSHVFPIATHLFHIFCPNCCPLNYMAWPKERLHNYLHFRRVCSVSNFKLGPIKEALQTHTQIKKTQHQTNFPPKLRVIWVWSWVWCAYPKTSTCCICTGSRWMSVHKSKASTVLGGSQFFLETRQVWVFRSFSDTRLSSFIIIIIIIIILQ